MSTPGVRQHFEDDLEAAFPEISTDDMLAYEVYAALCNTRWSQEEKDRWYESSWRYAGMVVARLRDRNEDYMNFYCGGIWNDDRPSEGEVSERVKKALATAGWTHQSR